MNIKLLKKLLQKPELYEKGNSVMWTDPYISEQLLQLHINPDIDAASRNSEKIKYITDWILKKINKPKLEILDLGCGPGLYAELFAEKGHSVTGVDFSQNSIQYAANHAKDKRLSIEYLHKNYLELDFECRFDLITLIYLDFCALIPAERDKVLENVNKALKKGGVFIFDVVNGKNIDEKTIPQSWEVEEKGFWKDEPYTVLNKGYHYPEAKALANHHLVIGEDDKISTYIFWINYYEKQDLVPVLKMKGFTEIETSENMLPGDDCWNGENITFYSVKKI